MRQNKLSFTTIMGFFDTKNVISMIGNCAALFWVCIYIYIFFKLVERSNPRIRMKLMSQDGQIRCPGAGVEDEDYHEWRVYIYDQVQNHFYDL